MWAHCRSACLFRQRAATYGGNCGTHISATPLIHLHANVRYKAHATPVHIVATGGDTDERAARLYMVEVCVLFIVAIVIMLMVLRC